MTPGPEGAKISGAVPAKVSGAVSAPIGKITGAVDIEGTGQRRKPSATAWGSWLWRRGWERAQALSERRSLPWAWAAALLLALFTYLLDLGAGSIWTGDDALFALAAERMASGNLLLADAARGLPAPTGAPLALWALSTVVRFLGSGDAALRLLSALAALGCAFCLLTIAIDVGVGRHAGGLGALMLLALPLTYELAHRVLPDMLIAFCGSIAVALSSHALHGHRFDRHILPYHGDEEGPAPLPLRRLPMAFMAGAIGVGALLSRRGALMALLVALGDVFLVHRYLLRKRRVWLALAAATALIALGARIQGDIAGESGGAQRMFGQGVAALRELHGPDLWLRTRTMVAVLWAQEGTPYGRIAGRVVVCAAGLGVVICLVRRVSRPLVLWLLAAVAVTLLVPGGEPRRGLALVLPPLALCAAVGVETPVRWLGRFGNLVTLAAVAGILWAFVSGAWVLHRDDTVRALAQSQRRAPAGTLLCTVAMPAAAAMHYTRRPVVEFASARELAAALGKDQPLSCLMPAGERDAVARVLLGERGAAAVRDKGRGRRRAAMEGSVLSTVLDFEEPPPDTSGPQVVLVNR